MASSLASQNETILSTDIANNNAAACRPLSTDRAAWPEEERHEANKRNGGGSNRSTPALLLPQFTPAPAYRDSSFAQDGQPAFRNGANATGSPECLARSEKNERLSHAYAEHKGVVNVDDVIVWRESLRQVNKNSTTVADEKTTLTAAAVGLKHNGSATNCQTPSPAEESISSLLNGNTTAAVYADESREKSAESEAPLLTRRQTGEITAGVRGTYMTAESGSSDSSGVSSSNEYSSQSLRLADKSPSALECVRRLTEENLSLEQQVALSCSRSSSVTNGSDSGVRRSKTQLPAASNLLQMSSSSSSGGGGNGGGSCYDSQQSHSSSLESLDDPQVIKRRSVQSDDNCGGSSTSCSVDSFEISSPGDTLTSDKTTNSFSDLDEDDPNGRPKKEPQAFVGFASSTTTALLSPLKEESPMLSASSSMHSEVHKKAISVATKQKIDHQLSQLDTSLPTMDFSNLEKQLKDAAKERETNQRKIMSEEVRRRLAMDAEEDADSGSAYFTPASTSVGRNNNQRFQPNLGHRLQKGSNLQMCFMNDMLLTSEEEDSDAFEDDITVPRSKSTPTFNKKASAYSQHIERIEHQASAYSQQQPSTSVVNRSASIVGDSSKRASELRWERELIEANQSSLSKRDKLEAETRQMLFKAKQAAHMQMEVDRQAAKAATAQPSLVEEIIGIRVRKKLSRLQLSKMSITQLQLIDNELHGKIEKLNEELVQLLIKRDSLHMEQDSMLVDIEDLIEHRKPSTVNLPEFLILAQPPNTKPGARFRIFKR